MDYKIKITNGNEYAEFTSDGSDYILSEAEENGVTLPFSCRAGGCEDCKSTLVLGSVDQSDQTYFEDDELAEENIVVTCCAYARGDVTILNKQASFFNQEDLGNDDTMIVYGHKNDVEPLTDLDWVEDYRITSPPEMVSSESDVNDYEWDWEFYWNTKCKKALIKVGVIDGLFAGITAVRTGQILWAVPTAIVAGGIAAIKEYFTNEDCSVW